MSWAPQERGRVQGTQRLVAHPSLCVCICMLLLFVTPDLIERYLSPIPEASYNYVQRWDYSMLAQAMCGRGGKFKVFKVGQGSSSGVA